MINKIIGADLALNHGALVDSEGNIIYSYNKGQGNDSSIEYLHQRALEARSAILRGIVREGTNPLYQSRAYIIAIDWDRNSGSWGKGSRGRTPKTAVLMTALIMQFITICRVLDNAEIHLVTPAMIRRCLNLSVRCSKEDVHHHCDSYSLFPQSIIKKKGEVGGDMKDAFLLAITLDCAKNYVDKGADF